jgi:hypothetical protein
MGLLASLSPPNAHTRKGWISLVSPCARGRRHTRNKDGSPPTLVLCSPNAHAMPIIFLDRGRCSSKGAVGPAWLPLHQEETQASFEGAFNRAHVWLIQAALGNERASLEGSFIRRCSPGQSARPGVRGVWAGEECTRSRRSNQPQPRRESRRGWAGENGARRDKTLHHRKSQEDTIHLH